MSATLEYSDTTKGAQLAKGSLYNLGYFLLSRLSIYFCRS